jgi:hypothetical protein
LIAPDALQRLLESLGLRRIHWDDVTERARKWYEGVIERVRKQRPSPLGFHLLMGKAAAAKLPNALRNTAEGRIVFAQAVLEKTV